MAIVCSSCGATNESGKFCHSCGSKLPTLVEQDIFCHECGTKNPIVSKFCASCGTKIAPAPAQPQHAAAVPPKDSVPNAPITITRVEYGSDDNSLCLRCHGAIENESYGIRALGGRFHKDCFSCCQCHDKLFSFSKFYAEEGKNLPVCHKCFNASIPTCSACHKKCTGEHIVAMEKPWHKECMKCAGCGEFFDDSGFYEDYGKLWHLQCGTVNAERQQRRRF